MQIENSELASFTHLEAKATPALTLNSSSDFKKLQFFIINFKFCYLVSLLIIISQS